MFPEDRVLVAYVPQPADFEIIQAQNWYRIPQQQAPKGLHAEYFAFYFGRRFGPEKWAIHYFAPQLGHELTTRLALFPDQPDHPRAQEMYYKVQLGPLQKLAQPIVSLRWRRVTFIHTTWDRFMDASEINDLFVDGEPYVDRLYATLKERGIQAERNYQVKEPSRAYLLPLVVWCKNGRIDLTTDQLDQQQNELDKLAARIAEQVTQYGGLATPLDASGKM